MQQWALRGRGRVRLRAPGRAWRRRAVREGGASHGAAGRAETRAQQWPGRKAWPTGARPGPGPLLLPLDKGAPPASARRAGGNPAPHRQAGAGSAVFPARFAAPAEPLESKKIPRSETLRAEDMGGALGQSVASEARRPPVCGPDRGWQGRAALAPGGPGLHADSDRSSPPPQAQRMIGHGEDMSA